MPPAASTSSAWLELPDGRIHWLKGRCAIGRLDDNDLVLASASLSRHHALVLAERQGHAVTDLHSSNGTYVNRELVKGTLVLADGDELQLGEVIVRYRCNRPPEQMLSALTAAPGTHLLNQVRSRPCWLLVVDIVGFSQLNEQIGGAAALERLQAWITAVRPLLETNGGRINGYIGDAIFAYWPCDVAKPKAVVSALRHLEACRARSPLPFRLAVHHGVALFSKSEKGEELTGQDVNFVFRAEKIAKQFRAPGVLSQAAVETLGLGGRCAVLGRAAVDGMSGTFVFHAVPAAD